MNTTGQTGTDEPAEAGASHEHGPEPIADTSAAEVEQGHDGTIFEQDGANVDAANSPTQNKSATGNRGTFDPGDPDICFAVRRRSETESRIRTYQPKSLVERQARRTTGQRRDEPASVTRQMRHDPRWPWRKMAQWCENWRTLIGIGIFFGTLYSLGALADASASLNANAPPDAEVNPFVAFIIFGFNVGVTAAAVHVFRLLSRRPPEAAEWLIFIYLMGAIFRVSLTAKLTGLGAAPGALIGIGIALTLLVSFALPLLKSRFATFGDLLQQLHQNGVPNRFYVHRPFIGKPAAPDFNPDQPYTVQAQEPRQWVKPGPLLRQIAKGRIVLPVELRWSDREEPASTPRPAPRERHEEPASTPPSHDQRVSGTAPVRRLGKKTSLANRIAIFFVNGLVLLYSFLAVVGLLTSEWKIQGIVELIGSLISVLVPLVMSCSVIWAVVEGARRPMYKLMKVLSMVSVGLGVLLLGLVAIDFLWPHLLMPQPLFLLPYFIIGGIISCAGFVNIITIEKDLDVIAPHYLSDSDEHGDLPADASAAPDQRELETEAMGYGVILWHCMDEMQRQRVKDSASEVGRSVTAFVVLHNRRIRDELPDRLKGVVDDVENRLKRAIDQQKQTQRDDTDESQP